MAFAVAKKLGFSKAEVTWKHVPFNNSFKPGPKDFDFYLSEVSITRERAQAKPAIRLIARRLITRAPESLGARCLVVAPRVKARNRDNNSEAQVPTGALARWAVWAEPREPPLGAAAR